ncbi:MAG: phosphorylase [Sphingobacteriales bacterium]|nr:MAG: phosphorylase [Sphingobacteriales bacterium]
MHQHVFGESELIINEHGTIYHLDLAPEQLADTVVTVGDPGRVQEVSKYFDRIEHKAQHREFITHTGYVGKKRISIVSTGIGPDNIDIVLSELDALANIDFSARMLKAQKRSLNIIRLGTCGSLQADVPIGSLIASSYGIGLDNLLHYYRFQNNPEEAFLLQAFQQHTRLSGAPIAPYIAQSAIGLRKHFTKGFIHGITVTCPGFYGPQGRALRAPLAYPNLPDALSSFNSHNERILNFEMETSAIYGLGKILGHQCLSLNVAITNRFQKTFNYDKAAAIDNMIKNALEVIASI